MRKYQKRTHDDHFSNGSIVFWSRRVGEQVPVMCGKCRRERMVSAYHNATRKDFTGLCDHCAYTKLRIHTETETKTNGSVVYWHERKTFDRNEQIPVKCGICGKIRGVPAYKIPNTKFTGYCTDCARTGPRSTHWKGGRSKHPTGYILVRLTPDHPFFSMTDKHHLVREHRLVMAEYLGRPLGPDEIVHHKNGKKDDNSLQNLELLKTSEHHKGFTPEELAATENGLLNDIVKMMRSLLRF